MGFLRNHRKASISLLSAVPEGTGCRRQAASARRPGKRACPLLPWQWPGVASRFIIVGCHLQQLDAGGGGAGGTTARDRFLSRVEAEPRDR
ncbi:hypothetical protein ASZ90_009085 [hydrocarbon metagenome]|uniref:Uncharacterized protein n=1 Tax=hydrocarbon metagenome TaxID=938273 RepID=A0A0W8FJR5_9ZZZZ